MRREQILEADAPEHLRADAIGDTVDDFRAILRRIDMDPERPLAKRHVDHLDDRIRDRRDIRVGGLERRKPLQGLVREARVGPVVVFGGARRVGGRAGMGEVIGALR